MNSSSRTGSSRQSINGEYYGGASNHSLETKARKNMEKCCLRPSPRVYIYRLNDGGTHGGNSSSLLQEVCEERGWKEYTDDKNSCSNGNGNCGWSDGCSGWNLWWRTGSLSCEKFRQLLPGQLTNHIPKASQLYRKDFLARYLHRMQVAHGTIYDFSPISFNLPLEYTRLCSEHSRRKRILDYGDPSTCDGANLHFSKGLVIRPKGPVWICKPVGRSQGKGILLFDRVAELAYDSSSVVQEYIVRPYLIGGYKWDLRIYACIISLSPLLIYAYREGLTRFATNKYDLSSLYDHFSHLTNTTLNKQGPAYKQNKEEIGPGCKWTLGRLRRYFHDNGKKDWFLWQRIFAILVLTIIGEAHTLSNLDVGPSCCFEFLGFDILVDENLRPTLLEVNTNPGLSNDCQVDEVVKRPMLHDLMTLLGLPDGRVKTSQEFQPVNGQNKDDECLENQEPFSGRSYQNGLDVHMEYQERKCNKKSVLKGQNKITKCDDSSEPSSQRSLMKKKKKRSFSAEPSSRRRSLKNQLSMDNQVQKGPLSSRRSEIHGRVECGDWVRIFPFDLQTQTKQKTQMSVHDVRLVVARMQNYLKIASRIAEKQNRDDNYFDMMAKQYGHLSIEPWHPH